MKPRIHIRQINPDAVARNGAYLRSLVGWTQTQLAKKSGVSRATIADSESASSRLYSIDMAFEVVQAIEAELPEDTWDQFYRLVTEPQSIEDVASDWIFVKEIDDVYDIDKVAEVFAGNLSKIRVYFGLTQKQISKYSGVKAATISMIEQGDLSMSSMVATRLHKAFMALSEGQPVLREFYLKARTSRIEGMMIPKNLRFKRKET